MGFSEMSSKLRVITICLIVLVSLLVVFIISFLIIGLSYGDGVGKVSSDFYGDLFSRSQIEDDVRIADIAMLGAHDAFSDKIDGKSAVDPSENGGLVSNGFVNTFAKGFAVRYSKAQRSGAGVLLNAGVRYFDVRISYYNGSWYTRHGYISDLLGAYLIEILVFLKDHPGEFIIFDIQDVYVGSSNYKELFEYIGNVKYAVESGRGKSLLDYIHYSPTEIPIGELTYGQVTLNGEKGGVVILCPAQVTEANNYHYKRSDSIRSVWHNCISDEDMINGIMSEYEVLATNPTLDRDKIRVNQAQKTFQSTDILSSIAGWSLLKLAENFNSVLIENEFFNQWFEVMPVFMVDYCNSSAGYFNNIVNDAIIEYNKKL